MHLKSFFFSTVVTVLLSATLFSLVVFLGMKYHWAEAFNENTLQLKDLKIPQMPENSRQSNDPQIVSSSEEGDRSQQIKTEILDDEKTHSPLANMTKQQVLEYCQKRFNTQGFSKDAIIVAVGNCVVTNYQEPYQEIKPENKKTSTQAKIQAVAYTGSANVQRQDEKVNQRKRNNRQAKVYLDAIRHRCTFEINKQTGLSLTEKKLLIETCVEDLNRR
jgi:hypothetical protein